MCKDIILSNGMRDENEFALRSNEVFDSETCSIFDGLGGSLTDREEQITYYLPDNSVGC